MRRGEIRRTTPRVASGYDVWNVTASAESLLEQRPTLPRENRALLVFGLLASLGSENLADTDIEVRGLPSPNAEEHSCGRRATPNSSFWEHLASRRAIAAAL